MKTRFSATHLITVSLFSGCLMLLGCDAEMFIPNSEMTPVEISKMEQHNVTMTAHGEFVSSGTVQLSDPLVKSVLNAFRNAKRDPSPKGVSDELQVKIEAASTKEVVARFRFSLQTGRIANDGREYLLTIPEESYKQLLDDIKQLADSRDSDARQQPHASHDLRRTNSPGQ